MEPVWLKRARRGARWNLVLVVWSLPFSLRWIVEVWRTGFETASIQRISPGFAAFERGSNAAYWGAVLIPAIGAVLAFLPVWWLTSSPRQGEANRRWRWSLLRWCALAWFAYQQYDRVVVGFPMMLKTMDTKALAATLYQPEFPAMAVISAMVLFVVFTELGDRRARMLAEGLVGLAVVEWLILRAAASHRPSGRVAAAVLCIGFLDLILQAILYLQVGWPRRRVPAGSPPAVPGPQELGLASR
jgi:hypothetical protein